MDIRTAPGQSGPEKQTTSVSPEALAIDPLWDDSRFQTWLSVGRTVSLWQRRMAAALAPLGLKIPHYDIVANVHREPGITQQRLAEKLLVGRSNLSMLLPDLEQRNLVTRTDDPNDRRLKRLYLTEEGARVALAAMAAHAALLAETMDALDAGERCRLGDLMTRLGERLCRLDAAERASRAD